MTGTTDPTPDPLLVRHATVTALAEQVRLAHVRADAAVISDVQTMCVKTDRQGATWWDTRPMLSPHERSDAAIDMAQISLAYGRLRGLIEHHPSQPHLVRLNARR
jgi:hypothetical protein